MSGAEVTILLVFAVLALVHVASHPHVPFSWSWLGFGRFRSLAGIAAGALVAAFYYWGWDVSSNLNEETRDSRRSSGLGGIIGVAIIFALFEVFTIAGEHDAARPADPGQCRKCPGRPGPGLMAGCRGKLLVIAAMLSTVGNLQTSLIQVTRTLFAMARDRTLPACLGWLLPRRRTPLAGYRRGGGRVAGAVHRLQLDRVGRHDPVRRDQRDRVADRGLLWARRPTVVIAFRKVLLASVPNFIFMGLWPLAGSVFMFWILAESIPGHRGVVDVTGLGPLALGIIPLVIYWARGSTYFRQKPTLGTVRPEDQVPAAPDSPPAA
jgi:hypothetical protein